jgi:hypothetical protein
MRVAFIFSAFALIAVSKASTSGPAALLRREISRHIEDPQGLSDKSKKYKKSKKSKNRDNLLAMTKHVTGKCSSQQQSDIKNFLSTDSVSGFGGLTGPAIFQQEKDSACEYGNARWSRKSGFHLAVDRSVKEDPSKYPSPDCCIKSAMDWYPIEPHLQTNFWSKNPQRSFNYSTYVPERCNPQAKDTLAPCPLLLFLAGNGQDVLLSHMIGCSGCRNPMGVVMVAPELEKHEIT